MMYKLKRISDGAGDSGRMSVIIFKNNNGKIQVEHDAKPILNSVVRVGTLITTMFGPDTWWQTTKIQEIIKETDNYVKFRTGNSLYEWYRETEK